MGKRKKRVRQPAAVQHFAARLRELRRSRGFSQSELAERAVLTPTYITKLEAGLSSPQLDTVDRLATALGVGMTDLLPATAPADPTTTLRQQAHRLADALIDAADMESLQMLCPLLARLAEAPARSR
jgi:transcriptional regulator with XRE-family HTH domain